MTIKNRLLVIFNIFITIAFGIMIILMFTSCDVLKRTIKNQEDRTLIESTETITKRQGDTVRYLIPKITYKDTTIYRTNRVTGTTQVVRYNDKGMIDLVECQSGTIDELKRTNSALIEAIKEKDKSKETEFKTEIIIYFMLGLVVIVLGIAFFMYRLINKNTKIVNKLLP